jgi:sugar lactone lactonase YvrE
MKHVVLLAIIGAGAYACAPSADNSTASKSEPTVQHHWTFEDGELFPADQSLHRAEDGVVLPDGTLLVADQLHGLVALSANGSHRPFGNFAAAGYRYEPPALNAGPNGVAFTPDHKHVLVADIFTGAIYRTDIASETTELIYDHEFGANTAEADPTGAIWFTQSTENNGPDSEARMFAAADMPMSDGALFRIAPGSNEAELKVDGLDFANGIVIDETRGQIYVAETVGSRINAFKVSFATGELSDRRVLAEVMTPDNIELDDDGMVWAASPFGNAIFVINPDTGETYSAFHPQTGAGDAVIAEYQRRKEAGEPMLSLVSPDMWAPMPGLVTGIILTPGGGPVYVSGLASALVKLER